jgi:hypothetical protein
MFCQPPRWFGSPKAEKTLTVLEARLLGTASAGHDLVKAITQGGNVDEAIKDFEKNAPTTERNEEYIEHPLTVASTEVEKLTVRLCRLITQNDAEQRKEILALAQQLLAKLEPTTVHRVSGGKKKGPHTASRERVGGHGERDVSSAAADKWPGTENRMKSD